MTFVPISIDGFLKSHIERNPTEDKEKLQLRLKGMIKAFENGEKCSCGNDIWVIGSAFVGKSCYSCITGETNPTDDYEIDSAIKKMESPKGRRHINEMDPTKIAGFFDDNGYEINMELIKKPSLCLTCEKNDDPAEELLCNMNRHDQKDEKEFKCYAYLKNIHLRL
jgi:hypothetical protein